MKTNQGVIVLIDQSADDSRLRSVLYDWGYSEMEIERFLSETSTPIHDSLREHVTDVPISQLEQSFGRLIIETEPTTHVITPA